MTGDIDRFKDKSMDLAYRYALFRDFFNWVNEKHPEITKAFIDKEKENDLLFAKFREKIKEAKKN